MVIKCMYNVFLIFWSCCIEELFHQTSATLTLHMNVQLVQMKMYFTNALGPLSGNVRAVIVNEAVKDDVHPIPRNILNIKLYAVKTELSSSLAGILSINLEEKMHQNIIFLSSNTLFLTHYQPKCQFGQILFNNNFICSHIIQ